MAAVLQFIATLITLGVVSVWAKLTIDMAKHYIDTRYGKSELQNPADIQALQAEYDKEYEHNKPVTFGELMQAVEDVAGELDI